MNTKVRDLTFNYEEDDFKTFLSFIVDSKESQEVMYSVLGLIDECNLLTKGCCEVLLGKEYKAYPGYITSKEAVLEIISKSLGLDKNKAKESKLIMIPKFDKK